ncbi:MAG: PQQ-binding-like beta-propeller repeat protein [Spirochaetales bacterium]|nr:PQQ-binding-like beta-propeller repeat protein [Spirochaetales bacterium]
MPKKAEKRVLAVIREKTAAKPRPSFFRVFRYSPALAAVAIVIVAVPLGLVLAGILFFPSPGAVPLVAVSDKGGSVEGRAAPLRFGDVVREHDVLRTGPGEQPALERKDRIDIQLFSRSTLEIEGFAESGPDLSLRLDRGSLYIDKRAPGREGGRVAVSIDAFVFTLKGTRVYFSVDGERVVRLICYDGRIEAGTVEVGAERVLFSLPAGAKAEVRPDGTWTVDRTLSPAEKDLDSALRRGLPRTDFVKELSLGEGVSSTGEERRSGAAKVISPYTITDVGGIAGVNPGEEGVRFYGVAEAAGRVFFVNHKDVFTLEAGGIVKRRGLVSRALFMTRPFAAGRRIGFAVPGAVVLVDAATLADSVTVTLPSDGSIDHNFMPAVWGDRLVLPVQNHGYYALEPDAGPENLRLLVKEPFPVAPLATDGILYLGSYYETYVSGVNTQGTILFKTRLKGNTAVNPALSRGSVLVAVVESSHPYLLRLDAAGRETGRWRLAAALKADFLAIGDLLFGVYSDGRLFELDTTSGRVSVVGRLFERQLTSRQWRNVGLCPAGGMVYAPTDRGSILAVDLARGKKAEEIAVKSGEAFYTAPFVHGGALYAVGNSGTVYRIVKNEP